MLSLERSPASKQHSSHLRRADEIEKALKKATEAVTSGLEKVKAPIEKEFGFVEREVMQQAAKVVLSKYGDAISALRTLATQGIASANTASSR